MNNIESGPDAPVATVIGRDVLCVSCSCNLKEQAADGKCPQCGRPVEDSLNHGIEHANSAWLLRQSTAVLFVAALACNQMFRPSLGFMWNTHLGIGLYLGANTLTLLGAWMLSVPDPSLLPHGQTDAFGRGIRALFLVYVPLLSATYLPYVGSHFESRFVNVILLGAALAAHWYIPCFLLRLTRRIGDPSMELHTKVVLWLLPLQFLAALIRWAVRDVEASTRTLSLIDQVLDPILSWLTAAAGIAYLLLLGRLHQTLRSQAKLNSDAPTGGFPVLRPTAETPAHS